MMQKSTKVLEPFTTGSWTWNSDNLLNLEVKKSLTFQFHSLASFHPGTQASLTEEDRRTFGFDMRGLHWPTYLDIYCQVSILHFEGSDM